MFVESNKLTLFNSLCDQYCFIYLKSQEGDNTIVLNIFKYINKTRESLYAECYIHIYIYTVYSLSRTYLHAGDFHAYTLIITLPAAFALDIGTSRYVIFFFFCMRFESCAVTSHHYYHGATRKMRNLVSFIKVHSMFSWYDYVATLCYTYMYNYGFSFKYIYTSKYTHARFVLLLVRFVRYSAIKKIRDARNV